MKANHENKKGHNFLNIMHNKIRDAFSKVKDELNEHRECLNQNTNEIQGNYEYICRLENKIDKLAERVDELSLFFEQSENKEEDTKKFSVSTLTRKEQEVFMAIYSQEEGVTYSKVARLTGLNENMVICYVTNLIAKGVPLVKRYLSNGVILYLDNEFRQLQAKKNVLQINETIAKSINKE
ncbi:MAG: hypothetical protein ACQESF_07015 [Nanobdellota archaeon]